MSTSTMGRIMTCVVLLLPAQTTAQRLGTIELSGFGRYTALSQDRPLNNPFGIGGALGIYFTSRLKLTGDVSYAPTKTSITDLDAAYVPLHVRLSYELPLGNSVRALAGGGYVLNGYPDGGSSDNGFGGVLGLRLRLSDKLWLNTQYTRDWMPPWLNPTTFVFTRPITQPVTIVRASDVHNGFEAGVSAQLGGSRPALMARVEPVTPPPSTVQSQTSQQVPTSAPPLQPATQPVQEKAAEPAPQPERFVTLEALYFDFDRAELRPDVLAQLRRVADVLRANPEASVVIEGHTDRRGSSEYNDMLGGRRAEAVRRFLLSQNVEARQIEAVPLGERELADKGNGESSHALNRRVMFRLPLNVRLREPR